MPFTGYNTFEYLYRAYSTTIAGSITGLVGKVLATAQGPLTVMLVLLLMVYGCQLMVTQETTFGQAMGKVVRIAIVVYLIDNAAVYNHYVVSFFISGLPNFFAQHIAGAPGGTNLGATFDAIMTHMLIDADAAWKAAPWVKTIYAGVLIVLSLVVVGCALAVMFAVFLIVQMLLGVTVIVGPLIILGWLFDYTKKIVNGWIDILVTLSVITLCINVLLELLLTAITSVLDDMAAANSVDQRLAQLIGISLVVLVLSAGIVVLPRMIERIAGGVAAGVGLEGARHWVRGAPVWRAGGHAVRHGPAVIASGAQGVRRGTATATQGAQRIVNRLRGRKQG